MQTGVSHRLSENCRACPESPLSAGGETVASMTATLGYARVSTAGQDLNDTNTTYPGTTLTLRYSTKPHP